ncbi:DUF6494 family protein [Oceanicella sp. SM1341]|uniref:DUF6494 family protein n=1 Tax=Oceanicella sp. SM1341 TaxID=1548889 RepID=UPI000E48DE36|nr:DUF6494 family protein [Oceanicella sp. SM1341]
MDDETFNMSLRKYLKRVGVTSQQEIEKAVRAAEAAGTLPAGPLQATVTLTVGGIALSHVVKGEIALEGGAE